MTKFMKKLLTGLALGGLVFATPVLAEECVYSKDKVHEQMEAFGAKSIAIPAEAVAKLIESKGPPPGTDGTENIEMEMVVKGDIAAINIFQNGCWVNKLGPAPKDAVYKFLGLTEA